MDSTATNAQYHAHKRSTTLAGRSISRVLSILPILLLSLSGLLGAATGTIMPTPFQVTFDSNGNPVSGGCIWTYTAGTSTPAATYSDSALASPNTNPIVADSAGRFTAWLSAGSSYKFTYEAACTAPAHGSVIKTVDNVQATQGTANPTVQVSEVDLRLTALVGQAITVTDATAVTTVFVEPFKGNRIALYDGSAWNLRTVTSTGIAVPVAASQMYDVFAYDNSTVTAYETLAWTNDTTRATALVLQDGALVKSGALTRRYLGSFRTTTVAGQTEDSIAKRFIWNYYNRYPRLMRRLESTATWTYTTATWRQANANVANQLAFVVGIADQVIPVTVIGEMTNANANILMGVASALNATTGPSGSAQSPTFNTFVANTIQTHMSTDVIAPAVGYSFIAWLEYSTATGTTTWTGNAGSQNSGISGLIQG